MQKLFTEMKIKNMVLKNRIVMAPMCMYCAPESGIVTPWHVMHYGTRAVGGVGLVMVEATGVSKEGRIASKDLGIWSDEHIEGLSAIVSAVKENGAKIGIQLNHAGRKCEAVGVQTEAPSSIAFKEGDPIPKEMTEEDIRATVEEFRQGALRAEKAGFDLIEIHAAHGYLLNEYLSPLTNHRTDRYGGSPENRVRFLKEVIAAIKTVWSEEKPLAIRVTAEDYQEGGNHAKDIAEMLNLVQEEGIDLVNVSTGGLVPVVPKTFPGYQVPQAVTIKEMTKLPVIAGGLITTAVQAEEIISEGKAELVYLGRELLRNPYWAFDAAKTLDYDLEWPPQYRRAK